MPDYAPWDPENGPQPHLVELRYTLTAYVTVDMTTRTTVSLTLGELSDQPIAGRDQFGDVDDTTLVDATIVFEETAPNDYPNWTWD